VLVDDDEGGDPIGEEVRATLDGHIVLSNKLAATGHYPSIDVLSSRSRVMRQIVEQGQRELAGEAGAQLAKFDSIQTLVQIGEYRAGAHAMGDKTLRCREALLQFLQQDLMEQSTFRDTLTRLKRALDH
jgi:type III secretion protein N (ATPase)